MISSTPPLHNRRFQDESGASIAPGRKLGEGGEGAVYAVNDRPGSVMKIWHPGKTPPDADAKLRHMVQAPVKPDLGSAWLITAPTPGQGERRYRRIHDADSRPQPILGVDY